MRGGSDAALSGDQARIARLKAASRVTGLALIVLGGVVLCGWFFRWQVLISLSPHYAPMKPNTALGFLTTGASLWSLQGDAKSGQRTGRRLAWAVLLLGALTLLEYVFGYDLGFDRILYGGADPGRWPTRMSISAATHFTFLGCALLLLDTRLGRAPHRPSEWLALPVGLSSFAALLGYLYGVDSLYAIKPYSSMALHTAIAFQLSAFGVLFARPDQGLMRIVSSSGPGGQLARRLLPAIVLIPVLLGWLSVKDQRTGAFGSAFGTAVFVASCMVCLSTLVLSTAKALHASDLERRKAELELQESEHHLDITLKSIGDGVITTDLQGSITGMNPVAVELTGFALEAALGRPLGSVFKLRNEDTFEAIAPPNERILREGSLLVERSRRAVLIARDGSLRAIAESGAPIRDTRGALRGVVLVFRDQTDERDAERALLESETRFNHLAYSGILGIIITGLDGKIHELNDTFLRMLGFTREDFDLGRLTIPELTPPEWKAHDRIALEWLEGKGSIRAREKEYFRKDGGRVPVLVGAAMLDATRVIAFVLDLTEQRRAERDGARAVATAEQESQSRAKVEQTLRQTEEQLRQSQKMEAIGTLAGSVAHDFNNLLSVIISYSDLLIAGLPSSDPMRADLQEIARAGHRAEDLTRQLLAFSRQQLLEPKLVNFNEAIAGMAKMLRRLIGEDVELTLLPGRGLGTVFVDPTQIEQVVLNLVVNARDAMPRGGKLTIESGDVELDNDYASEHLGVEPGAYVMLSVSDTGTGMDQATQSRIFEPFFSTKPRGKGTGLGLSTVFGIVKQSGGSIWVYSEPGEGTTFKIYLPRAAGMVQGQERPSVISGALRGVEGVETILLTEDDQQVRELACAILRKHGYHVIEASSAGDALLICEQYKGRIHLLLTDVVMPRIGGRKLWERISPLRPGMKVLFMSGYADDAIIHHGVLSSEFAFVQKPLMPVLLLTKLRSVLDDQRRSSPPSGAGSKLRPNDG
jgi:PAS domain S-box-containing protein